MSDIRFNKWLHNSGTGGVSQDSNGWVGIGTTVARQSLDVEGGHVNVSGVVTATSFHGDGANLTGLTNVGGASGVDFNDGVEARWGTNNDLVIEHVSNNSKISAAGAGSLIIEATAANQDIYLQAKDHLYLRTNDNETAIRCIPNGGVELHYDTTKVVETLSSGAQVTGNLGIGVAPSRELHVKGLDAIVRVESTSATGRNVIEFFDSSAAKGSIGWPASGNDHMAIQQDENADMWFSTNGTERARIASGGQVLIGGTSSVAGWGQANRFQVQGTDWSTSGATIAKLGNNSNSPNLVFTASRGSSVGTVVQDGDSLGYITFTGDDGTDVSSNAAKIFCQVDGTPGSNDLPGRLIFSTTADGADSASERLRITSAGKVLIGTTTPQGNANADDLVVATSGHSGISIRSGTSHNGNLFFADGTSGTDEYRGWVTYEHTNNHLTFGCNGGEVCRMQAGRFGIGTNSPTRTLEVRGPNDSHLAITVPGTSQTSALLFGDSGDDDVGAISYVHSDNSMRFVTNAAERLRIIANGTITCGHGSAINLHGSTTPGICLNGNGNSGQIIANISGNRALIIGRQSNYGQCIEFFQGTNTNEAGISVPAANVMGLEAAGSERVRITSGGQGQIIVGDQVPGTSTTIDSESAMIQCNRRENGRGGILHGISWGGGGPRITLAKSGSSTVGTNSVCSNGDGLGTIIFAGDDGTDFARSVMLMGLVNATPGNDDMAGEFRIYTSADASHSPTVRYSVNCRGIHQMDCHSGGEEALSVNRVVADGTIIGLEQAGTQEGNIAVSGSTVSYNGGHLSRWSKIAGISETDKSARPTIYQGTVMSNLDELCVWSHPATDAVLYTQQDADNGLIPDDKNVGDVNIPARDAWIEDNQQLNKTKVSTVEGDKDVAGVFWTWDDADDEYVNDYYIAMTGDMVIRVAGSTSVARGDLLESAGDGTAKPQSDDIVRSKTIAKIISTTSTATYADGSKAYPCVLMAC